MLIDDLKPRGLTKPRSPSCLAPKKVMSDGHPRRSGYYADAKVHAESMAAAADEGAKNSLSSRKRRYQRREDNLKALAVTIMRVMQRKEIRTSRPVRLRHRAGNERAFVEITNPELDPGHLCSRS